VLILERPWTRQPQTVVKGRTDGIGAGLVAYGTGAVDNDWEAVNGPTRTVGQNGIGRTFVSASSQYVKRNLVLSQPLTVFALVKLATLNANQGYVSIGGSDQRHLLYSSNTATWFFSGSGGTYGQAAGGILTAGLWYSLVGRAQSSTSRQVFINGIQRGTDTTAVSPTASSLCVAGASWSSGAPQAGFYLNGDMAVWGVWNRALTDGEIMSLYVNPWQLFAPRRIYIPTATAAGYTHPTLSAATATEITATSFKPSVTYTFT
jgi:hypothetical protein